MISLADRNFAPVLLGSVRPDEPHPELTASALTIRRDKRLRRLAKSAAYQLRHLGDMAAVEFFLSRAALASNGGADPAAWLEAQVQNIKLEQSLTREEHSRMAARIEDSADKDGHKQKNAYIPGQSHIGGTVFDRGVLP